MAEAVSLFYERLGQQQASRHKNSTLFQMLRQNVLAVELLNQFHALQHMVQDEDGTLCQYLRRIGEEPAVGQQPNEDRAIHRGGSDRAAQLLL